MVERLFRLARQAVESMVAHARAEAPAECCGVLVGAGGRIDQAVAARNVAAGSDGAASASRFVLNPADHFRVRREARERGLEVVGFYHSHPHSPAWPSERDVAEATYADAACAIVSLAGAVPDVRLFQIGQGTSTEVPFEITEPAMESAGSVSDLFLDYSRYRLEQDWLRLRGCIERLTDEQVWWRPNERSNSVGNLVLHLNGNVRQWLVASFSGADDLRNRSAEFAERRGPTRAALLEQMDATLRDALAILSRLTETDLRRSLDIQGDTVSGTAAVYQVVEHLAMHYGQVLYVTKMLRDEDLGFYRHLDGTGRADTPDAD